MDLLKEKILVAWVSCETLMNSFPGCNEFWRLDSLCRQTASVPQKWLQYFLKMWLSNFKNCKERNWTQWVWWLGKNPVYFILSDLLLTLYVFYSCINSLREQVVLAPIRLLNLVKKHAVQVMDGHVNLLHFEFKRGCQDKTSYLFLVLFSFNKKVSL